MLTAKSYTKNTIENKNKSGDLSLYSAISLASFLTLGKSHINL